MSGTGFSRRDFLQNSSALAGAAVAAGSFGTGASAQSGADTAQVGEAVLGRTGVEVSRMGIGCGHFRHDHVTAEIVYDIVQRGLELGITYIDTAPNYGNAEDKLGHVIPEVRDKVFLVTKTEEPSYEGTWRLLRESMRRMKTDYIDLLHIHSTGNQERYPDIDVPLRENGSLAALREAKKQGVIRFIGATGHNWPSRTHKVLDTGEIDVLMNAVNFVTQHVYDWESKVWSRARAENIGLVAMKVLGGRGPDGCRLPKEHYEQAIRYALSIPDVACAVIGVESVAELERAARLIATASPLSNEESYQLAKIGLDIAQQESWHSPYGTPTA